MNMTYFKTLLSHKTNFKRAVVELSGLLLQNGIQESRPQTVFSYLDGWVNDKNNRFYAGDERKSHSKFSNDEEYDSRLEL